MTTAPASRSEAVYFKIDGEWLTDHCRGLVTEGRWRDGMKTLTEGLEGITLDEAISILRGTHKLVGIKVDLVEEDRGEVAAEYLDLVAWQYAGLWSRSGHGLWRPYATVGALDGPDVPASRLFPGPVPGVGSWNDQKALARWSRLRFLYYADSPEEDTATVERLGSRQRVPVLWKRVVDPPLWLAGASESAGALNEYLQCGHCLEERGPEQTGQPTPGHMESSRSVFVPLTQVLTDMDSLMGEPQGAADRLIERLGLQGKMADAARAIAGDGSNVSLEPDREFSSESGYILPDGRFYGCPYMHHSRLADQLLRKEFDVEADDPQKEADARNWLRIQASAFIGTTPVGSGFVILSPKGRPTSAQKRALADWCIAHEQPYPPDLA